MNGENRTNTNNTHKSKASPGKHLPVLVCTLLAAAALTVGAISRARSGSDTQKAITDGSSPSSLCASQDSSGTKEQEPVTTSATTSAENTQTEIKTRPSHLEAAKPAAVTAAHKTEVKNGITYVGIEQFLMNDANELNSCRCRDNPLSFPFYISPFEKGFNNCCSG